MQGSAIALKRTAGIGRPTVGAALDRVLPTAPAPRSIAVEAVDQGTQFMARALEDWAYQRRVQLDFVRLGKPADNPFIESFNTSPSTRSEGTMTEQSGRGSRSADQADDGANVAVIVWGGEAELESSAFPAGFANPTDEESHCDLLAPQLLVRMNLVGL